jgi:hypothetical protein
MGIDPSQEQGISSEKKSHKKKRDDASRIVPFKRLLWHPQLKAGGFALHSYRALCVTSVVHTAGPSYFDCSTRPIVMISASFVPS